MKFFSSHYVQIQLLQQIKNVMFTKKIISICYMIYLYHQLLSYTIRFTKRIFTTTGKIYNIM